MDLHGLLAPVEAADGKRPDLGQRARCRELDEQRLAAALDAEIVDLGGARIPAARPDPLQAMPVAERQIVKPRALRTGGVDQVGLAPRIGAEGADRAVGEADPEHVRRRRRLVHPEGRIRKRAPPDKRRRQELRLTAGQGDGRRLEVDPDIVRQPSAQHALPGPTRLMRVVVAGDDMPAHVRNGAHALERLAERPVLGAREIVNVARDQHDRRRLLQCQAAKRRDRLQARRLQHARGRIVDESENLANLPVGGVDEAHGQTPECNSRERRLRPPSTPATGKRRDPSQLRLVELYLPATGRQRKRKRRAAPARERGGGTAGGSAAHAGAGRVVESGRHDPGRAVVAEDRDFEVGIRGGEGGLEVGERDALPDRVAVAARGREADHPAVGQHRFVAVGIGIGGLDHERREALARCLLLLAEHGLAADEVRPWRGR